MLFLEALFRAGGTALAPPTGLSATPTTSTNIDLAWTDGGSYDVQVYRDGVYLATVSAGVQAYSDSTVSPGNEYVYKVRHYNGTNYSVFSAEVASASAPVAPVITTVQQNGTAVSIFWTNAATTQTAVYVYRDGVEIATLGAASLSHIDPAPTTGAHTYTVKNYDSTIPAYSVASNDGNITVLGTPPDPTGFTATAVGETAIDLSWTDGAGDASVEVYRDTFSPPTTLRTTVGGGVQSYSDTGLSSATLYYYRIRHVRVGLYSGYVSDSETTNSPAPADPGSFAVTSTHADRNALSWTTDGTSQIEVYRDIFSPPTTLRTTLAAGTTSYNDDNLQQSTLYYYRIRHKAGGSYSNYVSDSETTLTCTLTGQTLTASESTEQVTCTWSVNNPPVSPTYDVGSWSDTGSFETAAAQAGVSSGVVIATYSPQGIVPIPTGTSVTGTLTYLRVKNGLGTILDTKTNLTVDFDVDPAA